MTIQQFSGFAATSAQALHRAVKRGHTSMKPAPITTAQARMITAVSSQA
ncbi:hypothetical protein [Sedimenticola hydrogenitrophicus]|nr:hypothetical protein [Sedimenticola hydrogenitrophicus]